MIDFQVTLGAAATPLIAAGSPNKYASWLVIQNTASHQVNMGGATVTATRGIAISSGSPGGSVTGQFSFPRGACLNNIYLFGTVADVINVTYEASE